LSQQLSQFWDAVDRMFLLARDGKEVEARDQIRLSLQAGKRRWARQCLAY